MLDFNSYTFKKKTYGGANGNKFSIVINNELYMINIFILI